VNTVKTPGLCKSCAKSNLIRRIVGALLMVLPIAVLLYLTLFFSNTHHMMRGIGAIFGIGLALYLIYYFKWLRYGWGDLLALGFHYKPQLKQYVLGNKDDIDRIRFPANWLHGIARLVLMVLVFYAVPYFPLPSEQNSEGESNKNTASSIASNQKYERELSPADQLKASLRSDNFQQAMVILEKDARLSKHVYDNGTTALHWALDDLTVVTFLLENGADANAQDNRMGNTPLHWAVTRNIEGVVKLLVKHTADPNIKNAQGETALSLAQEKKFGNISAVLKQAGGK